MKSLRMNRSLILAVGVLIFANHFILPAEARADCGPPRHYIEEYSFWWNGGPSGWVTGQCEFFCDGTVECTGTKEEPQFLIIERTFLESCPPCEPEW